MKKYAVMFCAMLAMGAVVASCSSEDEAVAGSAEGKGLVKLALNVGADFQSRAFSESDYENLADYTVQILNKDGNVVEGCEWTGTTIPEELIELDNGTYTVLAFAGEEYKNEGATTEGMYMEGTAEFGVNSEQVATATVNCTPQCARVTVNFDPEIATYFQDYYVLFTGTKALNKTQYPWAKENTDPVYMAVDGTEELTATIKLVDKEGKVAEDIVLTHQISAAKAWKLNIAPVVEEATGNIGITIDIDDSTHDIPIDIEIPSDWL